MGAYVADYTSELALLTALGSVIAAIAAWRAANVSSQTNKQTRVIREDDELLTHAGKCLERSYEALMRNSADGVVPLRDRFNWLLCARLLEEYKDTKAKISSQVIKSRCEGEEDYWRYKIRGRLKTIECSMGYYQSGDQSIGTIYPTSAIIVHAFAEWPDGKADPIDRYPSSDDAFKQLGVSRQWASLLQYLGKLN